MVYPEIQPVMYQVERLRSIRTPIVVAIDGRSGTGKSTLGRELAIAVGGVYIDQDDFYAGGELDAWESLSPEDRAYRCIDWRRVRDDVLAPLKKSRAARYFPFDWETMAGQSSDPVRIEPTDVVVLDGAYSTRPELADLLDLTVLVTLDDHLRRQRLKVREGTDWTEEWFEVWDATEDYYFGVLRPPEAFDIVLDRTPSRSI